ncbi:MAG: glycosyltransferase family 39 protein, partial [Solirubrobacterales bacterium]|nr:glycosyltransferase family 39 protein [Solirubrobacterales bacterium]
MARRIQSLQSRPLALLAILSLLSLAARVALIGEPCRAPCRASADHILVFDESYYVNAARVIAGVRPPPGATYADAPLGDDPNAEHPQLAKLVIAGSIELFGDGPLAWRLGSLICGSLAILGLYALVRAAGGGPWVALAASALMTFDNLALVHGRIGTLDIYALTAMIWAAVAYLRGRPLLAGALIGVGACCKLVAPYLLPALALFEGFQWLIDRQDAVRRLKRLGACAICAAGVFYLLLAILDRIARPFDPVAGKLVGGGPLGHLAHMISYGASQSSPHGPTGIASYPWEWLVDLKPIMYLNINPSQPAPGLYDIHPAAHFIGMISPPIMLLALPALALALPGAVQARNDVGVIALAWFVGTFVPFELLSLIWSRTSYLYYMVIVMPGIYIAVAELVTRIRVNAKLIGAWAASVV